MQVGPSYYNADTGNEDRYQMNFNLVSNLESFGEPPYLLKDPFYSFQSYFSSLECCGVCSHNHLSYKGLDRQSNVIPLGVFFIIHL